MTHGPLSRLRPPGPEGDPKATLRWVRRFEVICGIASLLLAFVLWDDGAWRWVLVAGGLLSLSPWPGARAILRKAERKPEILVSDAGRRRARGRRTVMVLVPGYLLVGVVTGYLVDGWPAAIFIGALMGASAALGGWWYLRRKAEGPI